MMIIDVGFNFDVFDIQFVVVVVVVVGVGVKDKVLLETLVLLMEKMML